MKTTKYERQVGIVCMILVIILINWECYEMYRSGKLPDNGRSKAVIDTLITDTLHSQITKQTLER